MALSASESALLTETCANMNVAANTCREVLEMLRNLGNTGVVDIATHNNSTGAHANDGTLVHASVFDTTGKTIKIGATNGLLYEPLFVSVSSDKIYIATHSYTHGNSGQVSTACYTSFERFLSDSNNTRLSFDSPGLSGIFTIHYTAAKIFDADGKYIHSGFHYNAGKLGASFSSSGSSPYGSIRPTLTFGTMSAFGQPFEINPDGIIPINNNLVALGDSSHAWKDAYLNNAVTVTSDRRAKKDIASIGSQAIDFIKALRPVSYRLKQGEGQPELFNEQGELIPNETPDREGLRTHWGLIAQEVKEALSTAGIGDAALWCLADKNDPDSQQSLRYEELIAPMIKVIQQQQERIEALERKVA